MKKMQRLMAFLLVFVMVVSMVPATALAADSGAELSAVTYCVANSGGGGSNTTGDGSEEHPFLTISHAIEAARDAGETNLIISLKSNIEITKTLAFADDTVKNITVQGNNFAITYCGDEDLGTGTAAITVSNSSSVKFEQMSLTRQNGLNYKGGILYVENADVTLSLVTVTNGKLSVTDVDDGGAAIHVAAGGRVDLENTTKITGNETIGSNTSGAIFVAENGELNVFGAIVEDNIAATYGTGIYAQSGSAVNFYSAGDSISVSDEIFVEVGANVTVGADDGKSDNIKLSRVYLDSEVTAAAGIATMDICGDTSDADINIEVHENYHQIYRLISAEANGYDIATVSGNMDETGWEDIDGTRDIRYMVYKGVPGLYFYYHTVDATFHDVDTLTGITGVDINGDEVSYYAPEDVLNSTISGGVLTIPEIIPVDDGDYEITFTVDEANKDYRIPTPDQIQLTLDGVILINGTDYEYVPDYENGSATIKVFADTLKDASGTLDFQISGEKYSLLTLKMNGPVYTMSTDITGQRVTNALSVVETVVSNGTGVEYEITREGRPVKDVTVVLYREGSNFTVATGTTDAAGKTSFADLDPDYSYYYVLYYSDSFYVIKRDKVDVQLSTLEGQKMDDRCDFNSDDVDVSYSVTDAENYGRATSLVTGTVKDTTVTYYVDLAQDTIMFIANQGDATTADTATFYYTGAPYRQDEFSKTMETNAATYGNLPSITMVGYTFLGWFTDPVGGDRVVSTTPYDTVSSPKTLWAHWAPINVDYKVQHWVELVDKGVNPGYVRDVTETKTVEGVTYYLWQTDSYSDELADSTMNDVRHLALTSMVDAQHSWWTLDGFSITAEQDCKVLADGSSVFSCYYDRNTYTITFDPTEGAMTTSLNTMTGKFGADIGDMLVATRSGYNFGGWYHDLGTGNEVSVTATSWYTWTDDISVYAKWVKSDTTYTIKVMVEDKSYDADGVAYPDGTYTQFKTVTKDNFNQPLGGLSDTEMTVDVSSISALQFDGFTYAGYNFTGDENATGLVAATDTYTLTPNEFGTTVIYLYYTRNTVNVSFRDDDTASAGVHDFVTITYGDKFEKVLPEESPTKPGYDFTGWVDAHDNPITGDTSTNDYTAAGDGYMDVFPVWEARTYYVTYVPGEGTTFDVSAMGVGYTINSDVNGGYTVAQPLTYDELMGTMPVASKIGYEFLGWQLQDGPSAGQYVTADTVVTVDNVIVKNTDNVQEDTRVLYAVYEPYQFNLVLDPGDGTVNPTSLTVTYGEPIPDLPTPVLTGYTFVGWMLDTNEAAQTRIKSGDTWTYVTTNGADVTAHAMYYANRYAYALNLNDVDNGNGSTKAHLFDMTISGVEIEFDSEYADVLNGVVAIRNGYDFLGWSTSTNKADLLDANAVNRLPSDSTLYAIWQPKVYELHINLNGGNLPQTNSYSWNAYAERYYEDYERTYGVPEMSAHQDSSGIWIVPIIFDTVYGNLDELTREHYFFEGYRVSAPGWYDGDNHVLDGQIVKAINVGYTDSVDEYVTLDAVWTPYFDFILGRDDAHFADNTTGTKTILRTDLTELPEAICDGYTFLGWYDDVSQQYVDLTYVKSLDEYRTFRAVFTPNITFDGNGGKVVVDGVKYDSYTIGLSILIEKYGRFFNATHDTQTLLGWIADDTSDLTVFSNIVNRVTPLTLTAKWAVTITFDISDGAYWPDGSMEDKTFTAFEVGQWSELPTCTLDGYTFLYWQDADGNVVTPAGLSASGTSTTVYSRFRADGGNVPANINVRVTNYAPDKATWAAPAGGWVAGENTFTVTCNSACAVALVRNGVMTELSCVSAENGVATLTETLQDNDEIIIVLRGDTDLNGYVSIADMTRINQYLAGLYQLNDVQKLAADADLSGYVSIADMTRINQYLAGLYTFQWRMA